MFNFYQKNASDFSVSQKSSYFAKFLTINTEWNLIIKI